MTRFVLFILLSIILQSNSYGVTKFAFNTTSIAQPFYDGPGRKSWYAHSQWWVVMPEANGSSIWRRTLSGSWMKEEHLDKHLSNHGDSVDIHLKGDSVYMVFTGENLKLVELTWDTSRYEIAGSKTLPISSSSALICDFKDKIYIAHLTGNSLYRRYFSSNSEKKSLAILTDTTNIRTLNGLFPIYNGLEMVATNMDGNILYAERNKKKAQWEKFEPIQYNDANVLVPENQFLHVRKDDLGSLFFGTQIPMQLGAHMDAKFRDAYGMLVRNAEGNLRTMPYLNRYYDDEEKKGYYFSLPEMTLVQDPPYMYFNQTSSQYGRPEYAGASPVMPEAAINTIPYSNQQFTHVMPMRFIPTGAQSFVLGATGNGEIHEVTMPSIVAPVAETKFIYKKKSGEGKDTADDSCVIVNPRDPSKSLVIVSNKLKRGVGSLIINGVVQEEREHTGGFMVFDLGGNHIDFNEIGPINNVDARYGFKFPVEEGGQVVDLVCGSHIQFNDEGQQVEGKIAVYAVNYATNKLEDLTTDGGIQTGIDVYGFCMGYDANNDVYYAFANSKKGVVEQYKLSSDGSGKIKGEMVRRYVTKMNPDSKDSQTEGCVVDDEKGWFYLGVEKKGILRLPLDPSNSETHIIDHVGGDNIRIKDIEGMSLYYGKNGRGYLVVSSQGSDEYVVYDRETYNVTKHFKVTANEDRKIDGAQHTDGLCVLSANLGGEFTTGILIVHDGTDAETGGSNKKLIPWGEVARSPGHKLLIEPVDPRFLIPEDRRIASSYQEVIEVPEVGASSRKDECNIL
jgi:3-phytase